MLTSASPGRGGGAGADRAKARYGVIDHRSGKSATLTEETARPSRARVGSEDGQRCQFLLIVQYRECKHQFRAPRNPSIVHKHHPPTTSMSSFGVECRVDRYAGISVARHRSSAPSPSSIVTNKPSTSAAMRRAARCPQSAAQAADAGPRRAGRSRILIAVHGLRSKRARPYRSPPRN